MRHDLRPEALHQTFSERISLNKQTANQACTISRRDYNSLMRDVQEVLSRLGGSRFRGQIHLGDQELDYLHRKGIGEILQHAAEFIEKRLSPASPVNDGKQTPWHNHPVFVAQHATATCCRGCLEKWHQIPKGSPLTAEEQQYIVDVIAAWLSQEEAVAGEKTGSGGGRHG